MLFTGQERQWLAFQELLGNPEWMQDPKYHPPIADPEDREVFWAQISAWAGDFTREEVYRRAQGLRIPVFPVNSISDVVDSDQIAAREFMQPMQLANGATVAAPSAPYQLSETPVRHLRPAPTLGRDNIEVICGRLDVTKQEIIDGFQAGLF
jgi:crotonobetainyl-CoA:carnitine CoA-transferase CaiB-like acyl-CoA transferase